MRLATPPPNWEAVGENDGSDRTGFPGCRFAERLFHIKDHVDCFVPLSRSVELLATLPVPIASRFLKVGTVRKIWSPGDISQSDMGNRHWLGMVSERGAKGKSGVVFSVCACRYCCGSPFRNFYLDEVIVIWQRPKRLLSSFGSQHGITFVGRRLIAAAR